ncbi:alpha-amylase-like [Patella vulgata]|uniref:alpha-amylase-like n=1 Tax=Patella vulgata TaxID=6465 RepID=UPI0024A856D7|nr:alpha-amylase-like [Patella vulgata]
MVILLTTVDVASGSQYSTTHCVGGRTAITHLFEWKWSEIAKECERFLGPYGYCGVQISPSAEHKILPNRPWVERYQPVSYKLVTRSGNEADFKDMVERCNKVGVRIYADVVVNHMSAEGGTGYGTAGSSYDTYTLHYPGVPYGPNDFNGHSECRTADLGINNYNNAIEVRNCRLLGMPDLRLSSDYVRGKIAGFFNHLIDLGVAGIRVDGAKHMWPGDVAAVLAKTKNLRSDIYGAGKRMFVYQEVIDMGSEPIKASEYIGDGRVTNFIFGAKLAEIFRKKNPMKYLKNWGEGWGMMKSGDAVTFLDNHDNQRGSGGGGNVLTHWEPRAYKLATAFMLAHPYGFSRIMSSYEYNKADHEDGPPHNADFSIKDILVKADMSCGNDWSCEHRWRQIYNMVAFRNKAGGDGLSNWWSGGDYQIAFSRGNKAFIAMNLDGFDINANLNTGLPGGTYCDVISGNLENGSCTGKTIQVGGDGKAQINVGHSWEDPMIAIHIGARQGSSPSRVG